MNDQRKVVYEQRKEIMGAEDVAGYGRDMREEDRSAKLVDRAIPENAYAEQWDVANRPAGAKECLRPVGRSTCRSWSGPRRKASPMKQIRERLA
jgi:preprotein translocase subunit SecA